MEFTKPFIQFPVHDLAYMYIESFYNKIETFEDYTSLIHRFLNISETTANEVKREAYKTAASVMYSKITPCSYESSNLNSLIN